MELKKQRQELEALCYKQDNCFTALLDEQLVQLCLGGVREAFDELVLRYRSLAYSVVFRRLGNAADTSDAIQQGFTADFREAL